MLNWYPRSNKDHFINFGFLQVCQRMMICLNGKLSNGLRDKCRLNSSILHMIAIRHFFSMKEYLISLSRSFLLAQKTRSTLLSDPTRLGFLSYLQQWSNDVCKVWDVCNICWPINSQTSFFDDGTVRIYIFDTLFWTGFIILSIWHALRTLCLQIPLWLFWDALWSHDPPTWLEPVNSYIFILVLGRNGYVIKIKSQPCFLPVPLFSLSMQTTLANGIF